MWRGIAKARQLLDSQIVPTGVAHLRTDFWWFVVEPSSNDNYDWTAVGFYWQYAAAAKARGLDVIVILKDPPSWALNIYNSGDKATFFNRWQEYCSFVASEVGGYVDYYQIGNEENVFDSIAPDGLGSDPDLPTVSSRCMTGLAAGEGVSTGIHKRVFKTAINDVSQVAGWVGHLRDWITAAPTSIDIASIDNYPGTKVLCDAYTNWQALNDLISLVKEAAVDKVCHLKRKQSPQKERTPEQNWVRVPADAVPAYPGDSWLTIRQLQAGPGWCVLPRYAERVSSRPLTLTGLRAPQGCVTVASPSSSAFGVAARTKLRFRIHPGPRRRGRALQPGTPRAGCSGRRLAPRPWIARPMSLRLFSRLPKWVTPPCRPGFTADSLKSMKSRAPRVCASMRPFPRHTISIPKTSW